MTSISSPKLNWLSPLTKLLLILFFIPFFSTVQGQNNPSTDKKIKVESLPGSINFLVVGDWGRNGSFHQKETADQMEHFADLYHTRFVVSTGDNIYDSGVQSINDAQWKTSFEDIYSGSHLQSPWYCVLGNHDYKGLVDAEINYSKVSKRWTMPARYFSKTVSIGGSDSLLLVFLDTSPFISSYHNQNGKYGDLDKQDTSLQLKWLDQTLSHSSARWKLVFGHHPIFSAGFKHGSSEDLIQMVNPLLKKYKAQFYICGHDHDLQHLTSPDSQVDYIVSGAGSQTRKTGFLPGISHFSNGDSGFALVSLNANTAKVYLINYLGEVLYEMGKNPF